MAYIQEKNSITVTKGQADTLIAGSLVKVGTLYKITGVHTSLYNDGSASGTTIFVEGLFTNKFASNGVGIFYNPNLGTNPLWSPYSSATSTVPTAILRAGEVITSNAGATATLLTGFSSNKITFLVTSGTWVGATSYTGGTSGATGSLSAIVQKSYNIGDKASFGGYVWTNVNGNLGAATNVLALNSEWTKVAYNTTDYNIAYDPIVYDYGTNTIIGRKEVLNNNIVQHVAADLTFFATKSLIGTPISVFGWGNSSNQGNYVNAGYLECVNTYGSVIDNQVSAQGMIAGNNIGTGTAIQGNIVNFKGEIRNNMIWDVVFILANVVGNGSQINSNKFWNTLQIDTNILDRTSTINSNEGRLSWIYDNVLRSASSINSNLLVSNCFIYKNQLASSNINSNNLNGIYTQAVGSDQAYIFANNLNYATINSNNLNVGSNGRRVYICNSNLIGDTSQDTPIRLSSINGNTIASLSSDTNAYIRDIDLRIGQLNNANIQGGSFSIINSIVSDYVLDFATATSTGGIRNAIFRADGIKLSFTKTFTGAATAGAIGVVNIPNIPVPTGYFIKEVLADVAGGLTGVGAVINLGIATDAATAGLDNTSGAIATLNSAVVTKVSPSTFTKATTTRSLAMTVATAAITAGTISIIIKLAKLQ